jgi:hypothetical protein
MHRRASDQIMNLSWKSSPNENARPIEAVKPALYNEVLLDAWRAFPMAKRAPAVEA